MTGEQLIIGLLIFGMLAAALVLKDYLNRKGGGG